MLGRFLEVSIHTSDVAASLAFYEALGFAQLPVGDTWPHAYGVVSDGRLTIGLHDYEFDSPALTFVRPGLAAHAPSLAALGIEFEFAKLGEERFNELGFVDPSGQMVTVIEARTFSPPGADARVETALGHFEEVGLATHDLQASTRFWDALGFVVFAPQAGVLQRTPVAGPGIDLGLYAIDLPWPVLSFSTGNIDLSRERFRSLGLAGVEPPPRALRARDALLLQAPEGTHLLLVPEPEMA